MPFKYILIITLSFKMVSANLTQENADKDTLRFELQPITVSASRLETEDINVPSAITSLDESTILLGQQQLALNESLASVPGLYSMNAENFAQDIRISIRGFGSRAAFGIRGIKILVDGMPESTPDGQGQVDNLDLGFVSKAEVLRGPSSAFYGNASGGVISLSSFDPPEKLRLISKIAIGDYGFLQRQFQAGQTIESISYLVSFSQNEVEGFRRHSEMKNSVFNGKFKWILTPKLNFTILTNHSNSPKANDPGALTIEAAIDRKAARDRNVLFNAGEMVEQSRLGLIGEAVLSNHQTIFAKGYTSKRKFSNRLPFVHGGQVQLERNFSGGGIAFVGSGRIFGFPYRLSSGIDIEYQHDDRKRYENLQSIRGEQTLHQLEIFRSQGFFAEEEVQFNEVFRVVFGGRFDAIDILVKDRFENDGDNSAERTFNSFSPLFGFVYSINDQVNSYLNISSSFETPTLSELSNNPDGSGGFNGKLNPQLARNYEIGFKGILGNKLRFDLALFQINLKDELVPYELEAYPGRTFFRNAGSSERKGIEMTAKLVLAQNLTALLSTTFSDFRYIDYNLTNTILDGKILPGIPGRYGFGELKYLNRAGMYVKIQAHYSGRLYADDSNEVEQLAYSVIGVKMGLRKKIFGSLVEPFGGINNLLDTRYNSNIRLNAWGGRYFEPAPGRNFYAGIKITY